jgi:hypothetical protein
MDLAQNITTKDLNNTHERLFYKGKYIYIIDETRLPTCKSHIYQEFA